MRSHSQWLVTIMVCALPLAACGSKPNADASAPSGDAAAAPAEATITEPSGDASAAPEAPMAEGTEAQPQP